MRQLVISQIQLLSHRSDWIAENTLENWNWFRNTYRKRSADCGWCTIAQPPTHTTENKRKMKNGISKHIEKRPNADVHAFDFHSVSSLLLFPFFHEFSIFVFHLLSLVFFSSFFRVQIVRIMYVHVFKRHTYTMAPTTAVTSLPFIRIIHKHICLCENFFLLLHFVGVFDVFFYFFFAFDIIV